MKNLITLSILLLFALLNYAQKIDLVVFSESGDDFTLYVNSIKQNEEPRANVKAKDLNGENFSLRIVFEDESIPVMTKNIWTENKGIELTAVVKKNKKGKYVLRYMGETPKNPETDIYAEDEYVVYEDPNAGSYDPTEEETNSNNETVTTTTTVTTEHVEGDNIDMVDEEINVSMNVTAGEDGMSVDFGAGEESVSMDILVSDNGMDVSAETQEENVNISFNVDVDGMETDTEINESYSSTTTTTTTITTTSSSNVISTDEIHGEEVQMQDDVILVQETPINSRCAYAMSDTEFEEAIVIVKDETFEDDKFSLAKDICKANCMTSAQVRDMNNIFNFEDTKLDFAKFAYDYVYDAEKYYLVKSSFTFSMSKEELDEYLENK